MTNRRDFRILSDIEHTCYQLEVRKTYLFIFRWWEPLTYTESENSEEIPLEFSTLEDAVTFITYICENSLLD